MKLHYYFKLLKKSQAVIQFPLNHLASATVRPSLRWLAGSLALLLLSANTASFLLFPTKPAKAEIAGACAVPGKDGPATISGIINTYYAGSGTASSTSLTLGAIRSGGSTTPIAAGDLILIVQMQDATINSTDSNSYGDGVSGDPASGSTGGTAGTYEYAVVSSVSGSTVTLTKALQNTYTQAAPTTSQGQKTYQVIRIPQYSSATVSGTVTAAPWNGSTGGIVAFDVAGALNFGGGTVDVDGLGFRGGGVHVATAITNTTTNATYRSGYFNTTTSIRDAAKGEGIAGTPRLIYTDNNPKDTTLGTVTNTGTDGYPNGDFARGAPGNAGGGGNNHNTGGGGGGNGGTGGKGGNDYFNNTPTGGHGGAAFTVSTIPSKLVMGGGGGAGEVNDGTVNSEGSGGAGGGMTFIRTGSVSGSGTINANGANAPVTTRINGAGGGGAGGTVLLTSATGALTGVTVNANGGAGASTFNDNEPEGPGGGGGGGTIVSSSTVGAANLAGGTNGIEPNRTPTSYGATPGATGKNGTFDQASSTFLGISGAACLPNLTVTKTTSTPSVTQTATGVTATYTITVANAAGRGAVNNVSISDTLPTGFTYASVGTVTLNGGATRGTTTNPTTGATAPSFGTFTIPGGGSVALTFTVNIASTVALGTYQNPATATYTDPTRTTEAGTASAVYNSASSTGEDVTLVSPPTIDLDGNNSSGATGNNYQNTFTVGGGAVSAADTDVTITDDRNFINSATITLTNRPDANESLSIDATAGGTVTGVTASAYNATTGVITLTSTTAGTITRSQYQAIIATLRYNNTTASPTTSTNRTINVRVTDNDGLASNTAVTTIRVALAARSCRGTSIPFLSFQNPTLESGANLAVGAVYRFSNVTLGVDALVRVDQFNNGATLNDIDGTASGSTYAFQPELTSSAANADSSVDFTITFVTTGTTTPTAISSFHASGVDIDGNGGGIREYIELSNFYQYTVENPTSLTTTISNLSPLRGRFESTTNTTQPDISLNATQTIATGEYTNVSTFSYRIGALNSGTTAGTRLNSLYFDCISYLSPATTVPTPPTIDLDGNNSSGATGNNYQNTFFIGAGAVRAADTDVTIGDEKNFIRSATITLTNRPDGNANESLSIDATAGGTVTGVTTSAYNATTGVITLTSTNSSTITRAQYQAIIATLKYNNTAASPTTTTNRTINVQVTDSEGLASNTAVSTISIKPRTPNLLLVKRITAINSTAIATVIDDPNDSNDTNANWPSSYLKGATSQSDIKPGDVVEYTIYFLSTGGSDAANASLCDLVPANTTFFSDAFAAGKGIKSSLGTTTTDLTNASDADKGRFYVSTETAPTGCRVGQTFTNGNGSTTLTNAKGAVVVDLGTVSRATAPGTANSYGFVKFQVKVD